MEKVTHNIQNYMKMLVDRRELKLEVRIIKDELFIEKIQFLIEEQREYLDIMKEILDRPDITELLRTFKAQYINGALTPIVSKFLFNVECNKALIYVIWKDIDGYIIFVNEVAKAYAILKEGDTYTLQ